MLEGKPVPTKIRSGGFRRPRPDLSIQRRPRPGGLPQVGYQTNEIYFGHNLARSERPSILWKDGKPDYLYLACHDEFPTAGFILKINDWDGE